MDNQTTVRMRHLRYSGKPYDGTLLLTSWELRKLGCEISPRGGITEVALMTSDGLEAAGHALCSRRDNFSRRIGRDIATGRAWKALLAQRMGQMDAAQTRHLPEFGL